MTNESLPLTTRVPGIKPKLLPAKKRQVLMTWTEKNTTLKRAVRVMCLY